MQVIPEIDAFERGVRPVLRIVLPEKAEAVLRFRAAPELQARIEELAGKSTEGELTDAERAEYAGYVRANKFSLMAGGHAQWPTGRASRGPAIQVPQETFAVTFLSRTADATLGNQNG